MVVEKAKKFMKDMYPVDTPDFTFSIGWLGKFKARYGIKNFRRLLSYEKTTPEVLTMLKKIRDEIQGEIDFN
ncbi:CENP-B homolog protein 2-like protein, partial [Tanacetum coccineum]